MKNVDLCMYCRNYYSLIPKNRTCKHSCHFIKNRHKTIQKFCADQFPPLCSRCEVVIKIDKFAIVKLTGNANKMRNRTSKDLPRSYHRSAYSRCRSASALHIPTHLSYQLDRPVQFLNFLIDEAELLGKPVKLRLYLRNGNCADGR